MIDTNLTDIPVSEYRDRVRRTQNAMREQGFDLLIAWSDCYRMANVKWLANFRPFDGVFPYSALCVVPLDGDPLLFTETRLVATAKATTWVGGVLTLRNDLPSTLGDYAASGNVKRVGIAGYKYMALEYWDIVRAAFPPGISCERTDLVDYLKSIKSEAEIRNMKIAARISDCGLRAIEEHARVGITERELARAAYAAMFENGADGIAFDLFVQTGDNAANYYLARPTDRRLRDGDTMLIDTGCRYNDYSCDNGRGVAFGNVSRDAEKMLEACVGAWEAGMTVLRPGMTAGEACAAPNEYLARLGYLDPGEDRWCGHGTGMDPEEEVPLLVPGNPTVLAENQTLCFNITLCVPGVGGCRVEDPVVIRKDGPESLSEYPYRNQWRVR